jgi:adenosylhomocysteine nucleosidase
VRLGVVTGLAREATCFSVFAPDERPAVICHGAGPGAAATAASALLANGCAALLSFGLAGGLDAVRRPGDVIVADLIVCSDGGCLPTDRAWRESLVRRIAARQRPDGPIVARIAGLDAPLLTPEEKRAFAARFGATAVDMESGAVAQAAAQAGVPFLAVRGVLDPSHRRVPPWLPGTLDEHGKPRIGRVLAGLTANPRHLPVLLRLAADERTAVAALRNFAVDAGPSFALA